MRPALTGRRRGTGQEGPSGTSAAARPPSGLAAERDAREAVHSAAGGAEEEAPPEAGSPTDTAP
jgi:hypothetical protein